MPESEDAPKNHQTQGEIEPKLCRCTLDKIFDFLRAMVVATVNDMKYFYNFFLIHKSYKGQCCGCEVNDPHCFSPPVTPKIPFSWGRSRWKEVQEGLPCVL